MLIHVQISLTRPPATKSRAAPTKRNVKEQLEIDTAEIGLVYISITQIPPKMELMTLHVGH